MKENNPLVDFTGLPRFNEIKTEHIAPALDYMLERNRNQIEKLCAAKTRPTWTNLMAPLETMADQLERLWAPVSHLNNVKDSEPLRREYEACLPKLTDYATEIGQNAALFNRFAALKNSNRYLKLDMAQRKAIDNEIRDFKLSGIDLNKKDKQQYRKICNELSGLSNQFSQNLLDATDGWCLHIKHEKDLVGLPETVVELARNKAASENKTGWLFGLQAPFYIPFMKYADNRKLREKVYRAYVTRASDIGPNAGKWDNSPIICRILRLRKTQAILLGYVDYATYSMQTKMAKGPDDVSTFLLDLIKRSSDVAVSELNELEVFARDHYDISEPSQWDYAWLSEKLKIEKYDISEEELRPYFPLPKVLQGMSIIIKKLFGVTIKQTTLKDKWHPEVRFYEVRDRRGGVCGHLYFDLFSREHKQGGAWMAECISRRQTKTGLQLPVAFLTCNFPQPINGRPSLLNHDEVITLFHEFGHGLHHLLTKINVSSVSGINGVPWDAVELPSQFLENWCWEREALDLISGHVETKNKIPDELLDKMRATRNFQSAMQMLKQIEYSLFDLQCHRDGVNVKTPAAVRKLLKQIRNQVAVLKVPSFNRFENSFGHIFSGGYAAGYYSYKWAEVLSADAFGLFEERGIFDRKTGQSFLENILEKGGSKDPMTLFMNFRGREPQVDALLRHSGL